MARPLEIGRFQTLSVSELVAGGVLLDGHGSDLFLPTHLVPPDTRVGDPIDVFIYGDHEGAPQATTHNPAAVLGQFACLACVSVTRAGAYLAWGIPKDLYLPPDEQEFPVAQGRHYVVAVCMDRKGERLIASTRLSKHFDYAVETIESDDEVDLLVYGHIDAGVQVVVDQRYRGLIHRSDTRGELAVGSELRGFVRAVRHDNRLDIGLTRRGLDGIDDAKSIILTALDAAGGSLPLHDRSSPAEIERMLGLSKKAFKRGIGGLYKARKIVIEERSISRVKNDG